MRSNLPVSGREFELEDGVTLMSTTDTRGQITYANSAFVAVSGFAREELLGRPHNLVRHPDMPAQAFADLWATLRAGRSWTALVKNRRKNGDHYWVRANVTPVVRDGEVVAYMSVRTKPDRAEVAQAEVLYRRLREQPADRKALHYGLVHHAGLQAWRNPMQTLSVRWRLRLPLAALALGGGALGAAQGLTGLPLAGLAGGLALMAVAASAWLEWQIAHPLALARRQALAVAAGRPCANVHLARVDDIGTVLRAIDQAGLNLRSLIDDVGEQAQGVATASSQIAQGNHDLSVRTEHTAANLQQSAASVEQMTASAHSSADMCVRASRMAEDARTGAAAGGVLVGQVVSTIETMAASSSRIADIVSVIDGIAFQTNILSLNAAVEAARAGDNGRGFAVVAGEVRALARRCSQAAQEIRQLIADSTDKVHAGSALANQAGAAMRGIVDQVHQVSNLIRAISQATTEQSAGIGQVNDAVSSLDEMTQQNAALVEQSAAAAASLRDQAGQLAEAVAVFRHAGQAGRGAVVKP